MLNKYLLNWIKRVRNRLWNFQTLKICRFRSILKLSERRLTVNILEEGLKSCAQGGRGNGARKRAPSQKFWGLLDFPLRGTAPGRRDCSAAPPGIRLPHRCFLLSKIGLRLPPKLLKDTHKSWVAYGPLLSSKEKTTKRETDNKNITQDEILGLGGSRAPFFRAARV